MRATLPLLLRLLPWLLLLISACAAHRNSPPITTIHVVRHAEKADDRAADPMLSEKGELRAKALAERLTAYRIEGIYTTDYQRTQLTAAPLAAATGIAPKVLPAYAFNELKADVLEKHFGKQVLIVGHTHSIAGIIHAFTGENLEGPSEHQYDRIYRITLQQNRPARVVMEHYGTPTP